MGNKQGAAADAMSRSKSVTYPAGRDREARHRAITVMTPRARLRKQMRMIEEAREAGYSPRGEGLNEEREESEDNTAERTPSPSWRPSLDRAMESAATVLREGKKSGSDGEEDDEEEDDGPDDEVGGTVESELRPSHSQQHQGGASDGKEGQPEVVEEEVHVRRTRTRSLSDPRNISDPDAVMERAATVGVQQGRRMQRGKGRTLLTRLKDRYSTWRANTVRTIFGAGRSDHDDRDDISSVSSTASLMERYSSYAEFAAVHGDYPAFLSTDEGFELFLLHLTKEFSAENLLFWREVQRFRAHVGDSKSLTNRALFIYTTYVRAGAAHEVNLDHATQRRIEQTILDCFGASAQELTGRKLRAKRPVPVDLFDEAQVQIVELMHQDSLNRFRSGFRRTSRTAARPTLASVFGSTLGEGVMAIPPSPNASRMPDVKAGVEAGEQASSKSDSKGGGESQTATTKSSQSNRGGNVQRPGARRVTAPSIASVFPQYAQQQMQPLPSEGSIINVSNVRLRFPGGQPQPQSQQQQQQRSHEGQDAEDMVLKHARRNSLNRPPLLDEEQVGMASEEAAGGEGSAENVDANIMPLTKGESALPTERSAKGAVVVVGEARKVVLPRKLAMKATATSGAVTKVRTAAVVVSPGDLQKEALDERLRRAESARKDVVEKRKRSAREHMDHVLLVRARCIAQKQKQQQQQQQAEQRRESRSESVVDSLSIRRSSEDKSTSSGPGPASTQQRAPPAAAPAAGGRGSEKKQNIPRSRSSPGDLQRLAERGTRLKAPQKAARTRTGPAASVGQSKRPSGSQYSSLPGSRPQSARGSVKSAGGKEKSSPGVPSRGGTGGSSKPTPRRMRATPSAAVPKHSGSKAKSNATTSMPVPPAGAATHSRSNLGISLFSNRVLLRSKESLSMEFSFSATATELDRGLFFVYSTLPSALEKNSFIQRLRASWVSAWRKASAHERKQQQQQPQESHSRSNSGSGHAGSPPDDDDDDVLLQLPELSSSSGDSKAPPPTLWDAANSLIAHICKSELSPQDAAQLKGARVYPPASSVFATSAAPAEKGSGPPGASFKLPDPPASFVLGVRGLFDVSSAVRAIQLPTSADKLTLRRRICAQWSVLDPERFGCITRVRLATFIHFSHDSASKADPERRNTELARRTRVLVVPSSVPKDIHAEVNTILEEAQATDELPFFRFVDIFFADATKP